MIIGWDVSTSAIGVCVKTLSGTHEFGVIYPDGATQHLKQISAARQVDEFCKRMLRVYCEGQSVCPFSHYVEDRLGGFTGGLTTRQTLMSLAAMNAVVSFVLSSHGTVTHIPPISAKRIAGLQVPKGGNKKEAVVGLARSREPTFPYSETRTGNPARVVDDMADAWLLAEAGMRLLRGEASLGQPKKAGRRKGKVRSRSTGVATEG